MPALIYLATFAPVVRLETAVYRYQVGTGRSVRPGWLPAAWRSLWLTSRASSNYPTRA